MIFNEIYKNNTWTYICNQYDKNIKTYFQDYLRILNKYDRIGLRYDGSVMIDVDNMTPFFLYAGEFYYYLQGCTELITNDESISYKMGKQKLQRKFSESLSMFKVDELELNSTVFNSRASEYRTSVADNTVSCISLNKTWSSIAEKISALFVDYILSDELNNDYTSRKDVLEKGVGDVDEKFAEELFRFALSIYSKVEGQIKPYISGKVMDDRKAKGVCPYCGGSYKGLFSKKCVLCGTGREK